MLMKAPAVGPSVAVVFRSLDFTASVSDIFRWVVTVIGAL